MVHDTRIARNTKRIRSSSGADPRELSKKIAKRGETREGKLYGMKWNHNFFRLPEAMSNLVIRA